MTCGAGLSTRPAGTGSVRLASYSVLADFILIDTARQWGDGTVVRFLDQNPDRWGAVWQQLQETERLITDCHPDVDPARIEQAARLCVIGWIDYRLLEHGTIREYRQRLEHAWKRLRD